MVSNEVTGVGFETKDRNNCFAVQDRILTAIIVEKVFGHCKNFLLFAGFHRPPIASGPNRSLASRGFTSPARRLLLSLNCRSTCPCYATLSSSQAWGVQAVSIETNAAHRAFWAVPGFVLPLEPDDGSANIPRTGKRRICVHAGMTEKQQRRLLRNLRSQEDPLFPTFRFLSSDSEDFRLGLCGVQAANSWMMWSRER
jgi:hypothetical protein